MTRRFRWGLTLAIAAAAAWAGAAEGGRAAASTRPPRQAAGGGAGVACDNLLPEPRLVPRTGDKAPLKVGPSSCLMIERRSETIDGRTFTRVDVGLDGLLDGYVSTNPKGDYRGYLTNAPEFVFPQTADPGPVVLAFANYKRDEGAVMSVLYPADRSAWNGKLWVTAHGATTRGVTLTPKPWDQIDIELNAYDREMLKRGYALAKTRRVASADSLSRTPNPPPTGVTTTLVNDRRFEYAAFNDTARYVMDFTLVAENLIQGRLGRAPARTYFYGHSAGARMGRGINYVPGLNTGPDGKPMYDGIFVDDSGAGTWLPVRMKDGRDIQFASEADRAAMVPQLEVVHQMYNNIWTPKVALGVTNSFLLNKRLNAKILRDKGLTPKFRAYEIRSISHAGSGPGLDVSPMWGQMFDMLDAWVEKGQEPPPTRSDWPELGDADRDGEVENPGLSFPEVACPLGVFYPVTSTSGNIRFAAFTGEGLEPLDNNQVYVDMNRNGYWDFRETPTQAWRRLGLLGRDEELTRDKYVSCVRAAAEALGRDGFLSQQTVAAYIERAETADLNPKEPAATSSAGQQ